MGTYLNLRDRQGDFYLQNRHLHFQISFIEARSTSHTILLMLRSLVVVYDAITTSEVEHGYEDPWVDSQEMPSSTV